MCWFLLAGGAPVYAQAESSRDPSRVRRVNELRVEIAGTTNTQAVLAYTAPDANPCTVKVSESRSLTPLLPDVDPALFPGADQDNRLEAVSKGTSRIFIAGKRLTQRSTDGRNYSRALQTHTTHYYAVTCGSRVATGSFTTANIPLGMTYNDVPQVDKSNPGQWMIPTQLEDRTQTIVDPQTGALLKRVSLDAEAGNRSYGYAGAFLTYGGFNRVCSAELTGPSQSKRGYLCVFPDYGLQYGLLYFIVPATGEALYLGLIPYVGVGVNGSDLSLYYESAGKFYRTSYTGSFNPAVTNDPIAMSPGVLYSAASMTQLMKEFDPSFDDRYYTCNSGIPGPGQYALIQCNRSIQDSYGWIGAFYGGDGRPVTANCTAGDACPRVVAAMNVFSAPATRWCALHNIQLIPGNPLIGLNFQQLNDPGAALGAARMATKLSTAIAPGDAEITVDGEPLSLAAAGDPVRQNAAVGDVFVIGANPTESVRITGIRTQPSTGQRIWTVTRASQAKAFPAGTVVWADCKAGFNLTYWKFLNDPHGQDATNSNVVIDGYWDGGGHADAGPLGRITEYGSGWAAVFGRVIDHLNTPLSVIIDDSPLFAGVQGLDYGNTTSKHPSYHQDATQTPASEQRWFLDMMPFDGGNLFSPNPGATLISGQLYQYIPGSPLARKQLATIAATGGSSLLDISGPGSLLSDQPSDSYKYCVATVAGECRAGSAPGDILINAPNVKYLYCTGGDGPNPGNLDLCLGNAGAWAQGMTQVYLGSTSADSVANSRVVTHGLAGIKDMFNYSTAKSLPDASWALFNVGVLLGTPADQVNVWMAKLPPLSKEDTVDRSTFIRAPISISAPQGQGIATAAIEFGYQEQGEPSDYQCTSRREACVAVSATVDDATPFYYTTTENYTRMPCVTSCRITLPVLPAHMAYFQVKFYDALGALVTLGERGTTVEGAVVNFSSVAARSNQ